VSSGGIAPSGESLNEVMGGWLADLAPWDAFATWTFSRPVNLDGAMYWGRRHLKWLRKTAGLPVYAFLAAERGDKGGLIHLHALVGNTGHLRHYCGERRAAAVWGQRCCMLHAWPAGYARVLPYDSQKGAAYYVSKYVSKQLAEWELWGFPAAPQMTLKVQDERWPGRLVH
jgi:hypothetical protein